MTTKAKLTTSRSTTKPVTAPVRPGPGPDRPGRPDQLHHADDVLALQRTAGNQATTAAIQAQQPVVQRSPESDAIRAALDSITVTSSTVKVDSLQPWVIFETLPWNPHGGGKQRLFAALKGAHKQLGDRKKALAAAEKVEAAVSAAPAPPAPAPPAKTKKKGKKVPTPAEAQKAVADARTAVEKAQTAVEAATTALKDYVKSMLDSKYNPKLAEVRAQLARTKSDLAGAENALRLARKAKRPVDVLTTQREQAKAAVTKAQDQIKSRLAELRAGIDAADWGMTQVDQTRSVYEVDGAKASMHNRVEAYATVTADGHEGKATRNDGKDASVAELLAKDPTIGASTRKILAIISSFEGDFTSVNTWDIADVTFGMVQWTTGKGGDGDLIKALTIMKEAAPAAFARRLTRYGIDVATDGLVVTRADGTVLRGVPAAKAVQGDPKLTAVLSTAGTDPELRTGELRAANEFEVLRPLRTKVTLTVPGTGPDAKPTVVKVPISALITSEFGVGVLANHTVHGGLPLGDLQHAAAAYVAAHPGLDPKQVATWGPQAEDGMVKAISRGGDAKRIKKMREELDTAAGTFQ
ncbi:hypothetical protein [Actinoplanes sp. NPDC049265]|uniref:hypothetical protein n=1 Tax=Actinoplanes sp. NPDC049265 TaxID=3363902 RepID=UPI003714895A